MNWSARGCSDKNALKYTIKPTTDKQSMFTNIANAKITTQYIPFHLPNKSINKYRRHRYLKCNTIDRLDSST